MIAQKEEIKMNKQYEIIYALCEKRGISIAGLCAATGISKSAFTELKSGRTKSLGAKS
jgi:transcriptional regulator with XRE-family HTH domain